MEFVFIHKYSIIVCAKNKERRRTKRRWGEEEKVRV